MSDPVASLIPLLLLVLIFYLLVLRPARKRQRDFVKTQQALSEGLSIMLASGIYGTITALRDSEADVEIAVGTVITVNRQAIASVLEEPTNDSSDESIDES